MARSRLTETVNDLVQDSGSVLWSFVRGEQLEFPVQLNFLSTIAGYTFEAVVIEADNQEFQLTKPVTAKTGGVQTTLFVRTPTYRNTWQASQAYNRTDYVLYNGKYWQLLDGIARTSPTTPDIDPFWEETQPNVVHLRFPANLGANYAVKASVGSPVYGFFELRVTEPSNAAYPRTWKPIRGMVELLFSPTDIVPDA